MIRHPPTVSHHAPTPLSLAMRKAAGVHSMPGGHNSAASVATLGTTESVPLRRVREILQKRGDERTEDEIRHVFNYMELNLDCAFLKKLDRNVRIECCRRYAYEACLAGQNVFLEGDDGSTFYVILQGSVSVYIADRTVEDSSPSPPPPFIRPARDKRVSITMEPVSPMHTSQMLATLKRKTTSTALAQSSKVNGQQTGRDSSEDRASLSCSRPASASGERDAAERPMLWRGLTRSITRMMTRSPTMLTESRMDHPSPRMRRGPTNPSQMKLVAKMKEGDAFGEMALQTDGKRKATIHADTDCQFATLERDDYKSVLSEFMTRQHQRKVAFLALVPLFAEWSPTSLDRLANAIYTRECKRGDIIYSQGDHPSEIFLVKEGDFQMRKSVSRKRPLDRQLESMRRVEMKTPGRPRSPSPSQAKVNKDGERTKGGGAKQQMDTDGSVAVALLGKPQFFGFEEYVAGGPARPRFSTVLCASGHGELLSLPGNQLISRLDLSRRRFLANAKEAAQDFNLQRWYLFALIQRVADIVQKYSPATRLFITHFVRQKGEKMQLALPPPGASEDESGTGDEGEDSEEEQGGSGKGVLLYERPTVNEGMKRKLKRKDRVLQRRHFARVKRYKEVVNANYPPASRPHSAEASIGPSKLGPRQQVLEAISPDPRDLQLATQRLSSGVSRLLPIDERLKFVELPPECNPDFPAGYQDPTTADRLPSTKIHAVPNGRVRLSGGKRLQLKCAFLSLARAPADQERQRLSTADARPYMEQPMISHPPVATARPSAAKEETERIVGREVTAAAVVIQEEKPVRVSTERVERRRAARLLERMVKKDVVHCARSPFWSSQKPAKAPPAPAFARWTDTEAAASQSQGLGQHPALSMSVTDESPRSRMLREKAQEKFSLMMGGFVMPHARYREGRIPDLRGIADTCIGPLTSLPPPLITDQSARRRSSAVASAVSSSVVLSRRSSAAVGGMTKQISFNLQKGAAAESPTSKRISLSRLNSGTLARLNLLRQYANQPSGSQFLMQALDEMKAEEQEGEEAEASSEETEAKKPAAVKTEDTAAGGQPAELDETWKAKPADTVRSPSRFTRPSPPSLPLTQRSLRHTPMSSPTSRQTSPRPPLEGPTSIHTDEGSAAGSAQHDESATERSVSPIMATQNRPGRLSASVVLIPSPKRQPAAARAREKRRRTTAAAKKASPKRPPKSPTYQSLCEQALIALSQHPSQSPVVPRADIFSTRPHSEYRDKRSPSTIRPPPPKNETVALYNFQYRDAFRLMDERKSLRGNLTFR
ncbi:unnamed protein product [Vitrella brassicaformis CCMP3155]|uniref:Cyclic nucleotide-binding domain-containing protein n=3 Tax=Vitrella brassicaformis TaxID=1169539 RepID=A0A0G4FW58_VITBC|nr:unnamed protein product [Vitrella brassicaformis CCMP3155]|eukprot:CEM19430.1 unnamed protein product [Vitrella brassicaformis CCMP3155]